MKNFRQSLQNLRHNSKKLKSVYFPEQIKYVFRECSGAGRLPYQLSDMNSANITAERLLKRKRKYESCMTNHMQGSFFIGDL